MSKKWYIARAVSGQENKVVTLIESMKSDGDFSIEMGSLHVPTETIATSRKGKQYQQKRRLIPGYFLMEIDLPDSGWRNVVTQLRSINGFIGFANVTSQNEKPQSISEDEARSLLEYNKTGAVTKSRSHQKFAKGEIVRIIDGPFSSFSGTVVETQEERTLLKIEVEIFGRVTPIEIDFNQVEKT